MSDKPMRIKMLGREIEVMRMTMLSDGYCLSTVNNAERLTSGESIYTVEKEGDTPEIVWLREHVKFCRQCLVANAYKARSVAYFQEHYPHMLTAWYQGNPPRKILEFCARHIAKTEPGLMAEVTAAVEYNLSTPNVQALCDFRVYIKSLRAARYHRLPEAEKANIIRIDAQMLFRAWQLLGSAPEYDRERLINDWGSGKIKIPFPSTYFSFSEGINQHLISHFFSNMPDTYLGRLNVHGFLAINDPGSPPPFLSERASTADRATEVDAMTRAKLRDRSFLWISLLRAIQDDVFVVQGETTVPGTASWKTLGPREFPKVPEAFYTVKVNEKKAFRDEMRGYGKRDINWSHRWSVAGHWRTYKDGRRVWINSYTKGPEDKPFVPSVRVYGSGGLRAWSAVAKGHVQGLWKAILRWWRGE